LDRNKNLFKPHPAIFYTITGVVNHSGRDAGIVYNWDGIKGIKTAWDST